MIYDDLCTYVRATARAKAAMLIVLGGSRGAGFSLASTKITAKGLESMLAATANDDDTNPRISEGGELFMRFDEIEIQNADPGVINVGFLWRGTVMVSMRVGGTQIQGNDTIRLRGISGRQRVTVDS